MPKAKVNLIEIEYETLGNPESKPILLIVGLGSQLISWPDEFCKKLVDNDFFVIMFDNRDAGLSTKFDNAGVPDMMEIANAYTRGEKPNLPYTLEDMADDAIGLLNALNIDKAHICGASLGGLIAQIIAYMYPSYVLSLNLIMSTTGNPSLPQGNPEVLAQFFAPIPSEREAYIEEMVKRDRLIYGNFDFEENRVREYRTNEYDRCYYPEGIVRQMAATAVPGNIQPKISAIKAPTLVIHGKEDPLHNIEAGKEIASTIPGAELIILDGMGHSLPRDILEKIVSAINVNSNKI
ncbi:MAG: alpha/beta hydrolase [Candidatus Lokiarchaeota archaeon]|nr:alpha/beta hydrolase [Candidatus Lokiarchaeota archaeon]